MRSPIIYIVAGLAGLAAGAALAATQSIHQKGRKFSSALVSLKVGDALSFVNDDTVPHNIYSTSEGNEFDLGSQRPGTVTDVTFTTAGEVEVNCAIHPRMKMQVSVAE